MLPLFEIQQLFPRLLSEREPAALLSDLDPLTLEMIHRLAKDHEGQLDYFHRLKFDKSGSQSGSLWHASADAASVSRLLDIIHKMNYDRPTIERHLDKLPKEEIGLYYAYMWNAGLFDPEAEFGTSTKAWEVLADRHNSTFSTMRTNISINFRHEAKRRRLAKKKMVNRVRYFLKGDAREIAEADFASMKV